MREITISKFKVTCLAVLDEVDKTHEPMRITRRGKPIAEIGPPLFGSKNAAWFGSMVGTCEFPGDIVSPSTQESEWDALRLTT